MDTFNKLTAKEAKTIAEFENAFEESDRIFSRIHTFALEGLFSTVIGMILSSEINNIVKELTAKGYKVEVSEEYYYTTSSGKSGPYVDLKISWW